MRTRTICRHAPTGRPRTGPQTLLLVASHTHADNSWRQLFGTKSTSVSYMHAPCIPPPTHAHTGAVLHVCAYTHHVFGEYLTPTTFSQVLLTSCRDSEIHLLTDLYLDTHQRTIPRTAFPRARAPKNPGTLRESQPPCVPRCCHLSQGELGFPTYVEVRWGRGLWGFTLVQAFPHPLYPILSITSGKELIAMAALILGHHWLLGCHGLQDCL